MEVFEDVNIAKRLIKYDNVDYPSYLRLIENSPPLYIKGNIEDLQKVVACVGTRHPTEYGKEVAYRMTKVLCENGYTVVSGLALGVDTIVHKTAINMGARTIAVLPCGIDSVYPKRNIELIDKIINNKGAIISEHDSCYIPIKKDFINRNRIISGISLCTVFIQAALNSGSMHTVKFSIQQERPVFVLCPPEKFVKMNPYENKGALELSIRGLNVLIDNMELPFYDIPLKKDKFCGISPINVLHGKDDYMSMFQKLAIVQDNIKNCFI